MSPVHSNQSIIIKTGHCFLGTPDPPPLIVASRPHPPRSNSASFCPIFNQGVTIPVDVPQRVYKLTSTIPLSFGGSNLLITRDDDVDYVKEMFLNDTYDDTHKMPKFLSICATQETRPLYENDLPSPRSPSTPVTAPRLSRANSGASTIQSTQSEKSTPQSGQSSSRLKSKPAAQTTPLTHFQSYPLIRASPAVTPLNNEAAQMANELRCGPQIDVHFYTYGSNGDDKLRRQRRDVREQGRDDDDNRLDSDMDEEGRSRSPPPRVTSAFYTGSNVQKPGQRLAWPAAEPLHLAAFDMTDVICIYPPEIERRDEENLAEEGDSILGLLLNAAGGAKDAVGTASEDEGASVSNTAAGGQPEGGGAVPTAAVASRSFHLIHKAMEQQDQQQERPGNTLFLLYPCSKGYDVFTELHSLLPTKPSGYMILMPSKCQPPDVCDYASVRLKVADPDVTVAQTRRLQESLQKALSKDVKERSFYLLNKLEAEQIKSKTGGWKKVRDVMNANLLALGHGCILHPAPGTDSGAMSLGEELQLGICSRCGMSFAARKTHGKSVRGLSNSSYQSSTPQNMYQPLDAGE